LERKLAVILAADVAGYSRLIATDEEGTLSTLATYRTTISEVIEENGGRIFGTAGDGFVAEFASAVQAVRAAVSIQRKMAERNAGFAQDRRLDFRIGLHLGDVVVEGSDLLGDGVNIAARLESIADPGGIALSGAVRENVLGRVEATFREGGRHELKNIGRPVEIWHWDPADPMAAEAHSPRDKLLLPIPDKPSIVVLPFDNMSGDPDQGHLADGVVESITAALSRIRSFFVIARNSAFAYKGRAVNVRNIGHELGVAYVLEGSVQRAGNRVRITVQLIEAQAGAHLWAERYDGALDDIFDLQDRITEQVAGSLQPSIRLAEIERARRKRPEALGAYDYTMRAMRHVWMLEKEEAAKGLDLLEKALQIDSDYHLALALAAWCHAQRSVYNWSADAKASITEALKLAERAAHSGGEEPLTLTVLGTVHSLARNHETSRVILERAIVIDPNSSWAWSRLGWLDVYTSRPDTAEEKFQRSLRLSPLDPMAFNNFAGMGAARAVAMDYEGAVTHLQRALRERPGAHWIRRILAACLVGAGQIEEAQRMAEEIMRYLPDFTIRGYVDALPGSDSYKVRAREFLRRLDLPE